MDEALTPDSSRFWPADSYREGTSPPSFDKQYVRDYLETLDWDKRAARAAAAARGDRRNGREVPRGRAPPDGAKGTSPLGDGLGAAPLKVSVP